MRRVWIILSIIFLSFNVFGQSDFLTSRAGIAFYNVKHDTSGVMYALPELNSNKIYKSFDSGATWTQLTSFPSTGTYNYWALGCDKNNNVYASTNDGGPATNAELNNPTAVIKHLENLWVDLFQRVLP